MFAEVVADLTEAVTGEDSPLASALAEDLGVPVVLDTDAFVAPTSFTQAEIKVSTNAPTLNPTVMAPFFVPKKLRVQQLRSALFAFHASPLEQVHANNPIHLNFGSYLHSRLRKSTVI